jgi:hypothetical protein
VSRLDVMKSLLRSAARTATEQIRRLDLPEPLRRAVGDALARSLTLRDARLTAAAGRIPALAAVSICVKQGRVQLDASLNDGTPLQACLLPLGIAFAPGGAKDVSFRVEPPEAAGERAVLDVVGVIASELARAVWGPFLPADGPDQNRAFVERDGDILHADLRTVPAVRAALARGAMALIMEALTVKEIAAEPGRLRMTLALPEMIRR